MFNLALEIDENTVLVIRAAGRSDWYDDDRSVIFRLLDSCEFFTPDDLAAEQAALRETWREHRHTLPGDPGAVYYVYEPEGDPPAAGWPLLVVLDEGSGWTNVQRFAPITRDTGVLLVVTSELITDFGDGAVPALHEVLNAVKAEYPVDAQGAVLTGMSASGSVTTLYARDYPQDVIGLVPENAPIVFEHAPDAAPIRYAFVWGELDGGETEQNRARIAAMVADGHVTSVDIVPGVGHVYMPRAVKLTFRLMRELFPPE